MTADLLTEIHTTLNISIFKCIRSYIRQPEGAKFGLSSTTIFEQWRTFFKGSDGLS